LRSICSTAVTLANYFVPVRLAAQDMHDNSRLDLTEFLVGIETDFSPRNN